MKIPFDIGEQVELISGGKRWIIEITICKGYCIYKIWNGEQDFLNVDEWQIKKIDNKNIGFNVELG